MIIHVIDNYYIDTADGLNAQVYTSAGKTDAKGNLIKNIIGYYNTIKKAIVGIYHHREMTIGGDKVVELDEALKILDANYRDFANSLVMHDEVVG